MAFGLAPRWLKRVKEEGVTATAVVITNPQESLRKFMNGYQGRDKWIILQVTVQPPDDSPYSAAMQCQMSQAIFGLIESGTSLNVKYDPQNKEHVVLVDDVNKLMSYQVKD